MQQTLCTLAVSQRHVPKSLGILIPKPKSSSLLQQRNTTTTEQNRTCMKSRQILNRTEHAAAAARTSCRHALDGGSPCRLLASQDGLASTVSCCHARLRLQAVACAVLSSWPWLRPRLRCGRTWQMQLWQFRVQ